ncbi:MAG: response regulator [Cyanobacteria bacterium SZAS LIN-5]|nr:response regulator [Cyanobacteria bacterium SZAS LIN-5]
MKTTAFKILVVDDTPIARQGTALSVEAMGIQADQAVNGQDAIARVENYDYALILMDYNMPDMDGIECSNKIRELQTKTGTRTPIVLLSASDEVALKKKCLDAGMDGFLSKTCPIERLRETVSKWLPVRG